ncbi:MAG: hypothetical protein PVH91_14835, partial [Pseudomonadales bacterium]
EKYREDDVPEIDVGLSVHCLPSHAADECARIILGGTRRHANRDRSGPRQAHSGAVDEPAQLSIFA